MKQVPEPLVHLMGEMYKDNITSIQAANKEKVEIELRRGVKQGDPLSPLLFNLALESIINDLDKNTEGVKIGEGNLAIMAFADDLVLIGKNRKVANKQLQGLDRYLTGLGMELSIPKCQTYEIVSTRKSWYI